MKTNGFQRSRSIPQVERLQPVVSAQIAVGKKVEIGLAPSQCGLDCGTARATKSTPLMARTSPAFKASPTRTTTAQLKSGHVRGGIVAVPLRPKFEGRRKRMTNSVFGESNLHGFHLLLDYDIGFSKKSTRAWRELYQEATIGNVSTSGNIHRARP